jgi:hypothetical protein
MLAKSKTARAPTLKMVRVQCDAMATPIQTTAGKGHAPQVTREEIGESRPNPILV